jgi:hypothetical protein
MVTSSVLWHHVRRLASRVKLVSGRNTSYPTTRTSLHGPIPASPALVRVLAASCGQIHRVLATSAAALTFFQSPRGDSAGPRVGGLRERLTWRSAVFTRFMSSVPGSGCLQLPVTGVSRIGSIFPLVMWGLLARVNAQVFLSWFKRIDAPSLSLS